MNTNIEYIHDFLENVKDDSSLFERILDDIHDSERLNNGDDRHKVYYLQLSEDDKSGEIDFWVTNIRQYFHLYVYAMLFNWKEQWKNDEILKSRTETLQNSFSNEISTEIKKFNEEDIKNVPPTVLRELKFISDAFLWARSKEVPHFTEEQQKDIEKYRQNYERYIILISGDTQEDISKNISKYISYCMTVDDAYKGTKCLTSFITYLSGRRDDMVNFDTNLKSISSDIWGIDTIRQSILKREINFPTIVVKLVIYSQHNICQNENLSGTEEKQRERFVSNFFKRAYEDFDIILNNKSKLEVVDQLRLTSHIKDYLINDPTITEVCKQIITLHNARQKIIGKILEFQNEIIESVKSIKISRYINKEIKNFSLAKRNLVDLLTTEIQIISNYTESYPEEVKLCKDIQKHIELCEKIIYQCNNEKYSILLLGEYQSGKTTTINAFCGGIPVGSMGNGDKTSAVPLAISYSENEKVVIIWKEIEELNNILMRVVDLKKINIDDEETRNNIKKIIESIRTDKKQRPNYTDDLQYLILCSLILEYWDTPKQFKNIEFSINEVHQLSRFPHDMIKRWEEGGAKSFDRKEVAFIFIKRIDCFCPYEDLKEMNCILMDCPGLFTSNYDTLVTEIAMKDANAILFIFPRDKEHGENIEKSLKMLKNQYPYFHQKLIFANNVQLSNPINANTIFESNKNTVKRIFDESFKLVRYDAMISYIGQIKKTYDRGNLDSRLEEDFIKDHPKTDLFGNTTQYRNFDEAWHDYCGAYNSPDEILKLSGFSDLKHTILSFAEKNKAYSIIVTEGIEKLKVELNELQHSLYLTYIEPYKKSKVELQNQWDKRIRLSLEFEGMASDLINKILFSFTKNEKSVEQHLTEVLYQKLFNDEVFNTLNENICDAIFDEIKELKKLKDKRDEYIQKTQKIVNKCINDMICNQINYCNNLISSNQDVCFQTIFIPAIKAFESNADTMWDEKTFGDDNSFKGMRCNYYEIEKETSGFKLSGRSIDEEIYNFNIDKDNVHSTAILKNAAGFGGASISLASYGVFLWGCLASGPIGWLIGGIGIAGTFLGGPVVYGVGEEYTKKKFREKMMPGMKTELKKIGLEKYLRTMISEDINSILKDYIKSCKINMKRLSQDKVCSLTKKDNSNIETNCFNAISAIKKIEMLINRYDDFYANL